MSIVLPKIDPHYLPSPVELGNYIPPEEAMHVGQPTMCSIMIEKNCENHDIYTMLATMGFRKLALLGSGNTLMALDAGDQVIGLRYIPGFKQEDDDGGDRVNDIRQMHGKSIFSHQLFEVEIIPKIKPGLNKAHHAAFEQAVINAGYAPRMKAPNKDGSEADAGYLPDGTWLGIDKHAIKNPGGTVLAFDPVRDARWVVHLPGSGIKSKVFGDWLPEDYISKQEYFCRTLLDDRIHNVLSDQDRERLEKGEFEALCREKPECFMTLYKQDLTDAEKALLVTDPEGLKKLCDKYPQESFRIVPDAEDGQVHDRPHEGSLSVFMQQVFEDGLYPSQALELMHVRTAKTFRHMEAGTVAQDVVNVARIKQHLALTSDGHIPRF